MVYYFTSNVVDPPAYVYVGKDKFESESHDARLSELEIANRVLDEELIKHGWEEDVW